MSGTLYVISVITPNSFLGRNVREQLRRLDVHLPIGWEPVVAVPEHLPLVDQGEGVARRVRVHATTERVERLRHVVVVVGDQRRRDAVLGGGLPEVGGRVGRDRDELDTTLLQLRAELLNPLDLLEARLAHDALGEEEQRLVTVDGLRADDASAEE